MLLKALSFVPILGIVIGVAFFNRVTPLVLGLPLVLAWLTLCVVLTSVVMAIVYVLDPANRRDRV